jgi:hypothetical protein
MKLLLLSTQLSQKNFHALDLQYLQYTNSLYCIPRFRHLQEGLTKQGPIEQLQIGHVSPFGTYLLIYL